MGTSFFADPKSRRLGGVGHEHRKRASDQQSGSDWNRKVSVSGCVSYIHAWVDVGEDR